MTTPINIYFLALITLITTFLNPCLSELCNPDDKRALLQIKKGFNNPSNLSSWDPSTDCCPDWYGIRCDDTGRVTYLFHLNGDFGGPIPPQIGDLPYLDTIYFDNCPKITGPIPATLVKLKNLRSLMITNCGITGPVPHFLGSMKNLTFVTLASNDLTGPLPPSLGALPQLGGLELQQNRIAGPIPPSFGSFPAPDFYLNLSHNQLSGRIPAALGAKTTFASLDFSKNKLKGDATPLFGTEKAALLHVDLSGNMLSFEFSKVRFPKSLVELDISYNLIYGSLPQELTTLSLKSFNVSHNQLCGKIPVGGRLQSKKFGASAYSHNRCLCGAPLPKCKY